MSLSNDIIPAKLSQSFLLIISPTKTMKKSTTPGRNIPRFKAQSDALRHYLRGFSQTELGHYLNVNEALARLNYERFQKESDQVFALDAYSGAQFKALDAGNLTTTQRQYLQDKLRILSGLYGILEPFDSIRLYRLPMAMRFEGVKLSDYWRPYIYTALKDTTFINLASQEYTDALDSSLLEWIDVRFMRAINGGYRTFATDAKRLRGRFVRYAAEHAIQILDDLKSFHADGYVFDFDQSTAQCWCFIKK